MAALLLWLAFRGTDVKQVFGYVKNIQPFYVVLLCLSGILSHLVRAWRWLFLLKPLKASKISLWNSFCAVIVGYAVNVVIPRGGEVVRLVTISRSESLPWSGVLSTMFIDRLLDIAVLVLLLGFTLVVLPTGMMAGMPWLVPGGVSLLVTTIIGLIMLPRMADIINWLMARSWIRARIPLRHQDAIERLSQQFHTGTQSLSEPVTYPAIALLSLAIWFFYWLNCYLMVCAFGLTNKVSLIQCFVVFTIGSVGVLVPTPGNVGSFHFLVSRGLMMVCGLNRELALAFASVLHLLCFVVITCIPAALCVSIQSTRKPVDTDKNENKDTSPTTLMD